MKTIPDNFPSYTSYSPKTLILHVDELKAVCRELQALCRELQAELTALKASYAAPAPKATKTDTAKV